MKAEDSEMSRCHICQAGPISQRKRRLLFDKLLKKSLIEKGSGSILRLGGNNGLNKSQPHLRRA